MQKWKGKKGKDFSLRFLAWFVCGLFLAFGLFACGGGGGGGGGEGGGGGGIAGGSTRGNGSLTVDLGGGSSGTRAGTRAPSTTGSYKVSVYVDLNGNGNYTDDNTVYTKVVDNATRKVSFSFPVGTSSGGISGSVRVRVEGEGIVPWEKSVKVSAGEAVTVKPTLTPAKKVTVSSNEIKLTRAGGKLFLGINRQGKPFASVGTRAGKIPVIFSVGLPSQALNGTGNLTATMAYFNGTQTENFPGAFEGIGYPATRAPGETQRLRSIAFAYLGLTDENGNPVNLPSVNATRAGNATCSGYEYTLWVPNDQISLLRDDDPSTNDTFEVPVWAYIDGMWRYLGEGELYYNCDNNTQVPGNATLDSNTNYCVHFCSNQYYSWYNLDYVIFAPPKTVCVKITDTSGNPVEDVEVEVTGNGTDTRGYSDDDYTNGTGVAQLTVPIPENATANATTYISNNYEFSYWNAFEGREFVISGNLSQGSGECDYILSFNGYPSLNATIKATVKDENGNPVPYVSVWVYSNNGSFSTSRLTDNNGEAVFRVPEGGNYTVECAYGKETVRASGEVSFTKKNLPPEVYVWPSSWEVRAGKTLTVWVDAWDWDGDHLMLNAQWNGQSVNGTELYCGAGYCEWEFKLDTSDLSGNANFTATVSDDTNSTSKSLSITILSANENRAPRIYWVDGPTFVKPGKEAFYAVYAWDPDGDSLTYSVNLNEFCSGGGLDNNTFTCRFSQNATLTFTATDSKEASDYTLRVTVVDRAPEILPVNVPIQGQPGDSLSFSAYVWDPDGDPVSFSWTVEGSETSPQDENYNNSTGWYSATLELPATEPSDGCYDFVLTASDGSESNSYSFEVCLNNPPKIVSSSPEEKVLELTVGDTQTFTVNAIDPDNDTLTYTWYLKVGDGNYTQQAESGSSFTYTFTEAGGYYVKVEISDGQGHTVSRKWTISVASQTAGNTITIRTGLEGLYVTRHDPDTLEPIESVQTDASGVVTFTNVSGPVPISVALTPDVVLSPEAVFAKVAQAVADLTNQGLCNSTCEEALNGTLPVACIQKLADIGASCDSSSADTNVDNYDTNGDNYLDKTELYNLMLACWDNNTDGKIEKIEIPGEDISVEVQMVLTMPPGDYDLTSSNIGLGYADFDSPTTYISCWWWNNNTPSPGNYTSPSRTLTVNWQVNNVPPEVTEINVSSGKWHSHSTFNSTTATGSFYLYDRNFQNDGNYTLLFYDDRFNHLWLQDSSSANVTVDYNDFQNPVTISLLNFSANGNNTSTWVDLWTKYKGIYWDLPSKTENNTLLTVTVPFGTTIKATLYYGEDLSSNSSYWEERDYWLDQSFTSLPSSIDFNQDMLNVNINSSSEGSFSFSGDDLSAVDEMHYYYSKWGDICDNATEDCRYYDVDIEVSGYYPQAPALASGSWQPDWSQILPSEVYSYIDLVEQAFNQYGARVDFHENFLLVAYPDITSLENWVQLGMQDKLWTLDRKGVDYGRSWWLARSRSRAWKAHRAQLKPWQRSGWFKPLRLR